MAVEWLNERLGRLQRELAEARAALETAERDTEARIVAWLRAHAFDCQTNTGVGCEACARDNVAGEIERGDHRKGAEDGS